MMSGSGDDEIEHPSGKDENDHGRDQSKTQLPVRCAGCVVLRAG